MRLIYRSLAALTFVACAADDGDFGGSQWDAGFDEHVVLDGRVDGFTVADIDVQEIPLKDVSPDAGPREETGPLCPVHSDACPPECAPFRGYRVHRLRGCYDPSQVISCVDRATESIPGRFCVVRVDLELFRTEELRAGLDRAAWRQCEMEEPDYAAAWQAIPCDEDATPEDVEPTIGLPAGSDSEFAPP